MANEQGITINLDSYVEDSAAGKVAIVKLLGVPHFTKGGFDPETGTPKPQLVPLSRDAVAAAIARNEKSLAAFKKLLVDIDAAQEKLG